jgi:tryptophan-rich sensory protein
MKYNSIKFIIAIAAPQLAGLISSFFTSASIKTWYAALIRPSFVPPNWVFAPVWTALFLLMGIALFLVWKREGENKLVKTALAVFWVQLGLNTLWSIIFFGLHNLGLALIELIILWLMILATIVVFFRISKAAAILLVPYLIWVAFAGYLNYSFWQLNRPNPGAGKEWPSLIGVWQASPVMDSGWSHMYQFFPSGRFNFRISQMDYYAKDRGYSGYWQADQNNLELTIMSRTKITNITKANNCESNSCFSVFDAYPGAEATTTVLKYPETKTIMLKFCDSPENKELECLAFGNFADGRFYKFSDDSIYNNSSEVLPEPVF